MCSSAILIRLIVGGEMVELCVHKLENDQESLRTLTGNGFCVVRWETMIGIKQFLCVLCTICSVRMLTFS